MSIKTFKWLKLYNNFFIEPKIKKLRKIAGGDTYTCIFLKMLLASINSDGILEYEGIENTIEAELALKLDEDETNIRVVLSFLQSQNIAEIEKNVIIFPKLPDLIGEETESAVRMRKMRQKNRQQSLLASQSDGAVTEPLQDSSQPVTTEIEIESEKELDTSLLLSPNKERENFKTLKELKQCYIKTFDNSGKIFEKEHVGGYIRLTIRGSFLHNLETARDLSPEDAKDVWCKLYDTYLKSKNVS